MRCNHIGTTYTNVVGANQKRHRRHVVCRRSCKQNAIYYLQQAGRYQTSFDVISNLTGTKLEAVADLCIMESKRAVLAILAVFRVGGAIVSLGVQHTLAYIVGIPEDMGMPLILVFVRARTRTCEDTYK
jgi:hypothetical protein